MASMIHIDYAVAKVRAYLKTNGIARFRLATEAGVPEGCVRNVDSDEWNPQTDTLRKLEKALPVNFNPTESDIIKFLPKKKDK